MRFVVALTLFFVALSSPAASLTTAKEEQTVKTQKRIFLNASKNRSGTTSDYAKKTFHGLNYTTVNLVDYRIDQIGQESKTDEYRKVIDLIAGGDVIVIGTPVYWSDMTGYLKTFIDRLNDIVDEDLKSKNAPLNGADVYLIVQGTEPSDAIPGITTVIEHICRRFFMNYKGIIRNEKEATAINKKLNDQEGNKNAETKL